MLCYSRKVRPKICLWLYALDDLWTTFFYKHLSAILLGNHYTWKLILRVSISYLEKFTAYRIWEILSVFFLLFRQVALCIKAFLANNCDIKTCFCNQFFAWLLLESYLKLCLFRNSFSHLLFSCHAFVVKYGQPAYLLSFLCCRWLVWMDILPSDYLSAILLSNHKFSHFLYGKACCF